jgi:XTP/dITP diphosphohydrolase
LIATQNLGKLKEFEIALSSFFDIFLSLKSFSDQDEVEENGMTYQENAHLKAIYFYEKYHVPVIADDSGLEVISLQHYPGIYDFEARVDGRISFKEVGHQGFGYDSIFIPNGYLETFSCMQPEDKLKVSHRGIAIKQFIQFLKEKSYAS